MGLPPEHPLQAIQRHLPERLRDIQRCPACDWHEMGDGNVCTTGYYVKILIDAAADIMTRHGQRQGDGRFIEWVERAQRLARVGLATIYR